MAAYNFLMGESEEADSDLCSLVPATGHEGME